MADKKKAKKGEEGEEKKGMGAKLKPILMIVAAGAAYKFVLAPKPATTAASTVVVEAAAVKPPDGPVVTIPELVLNLAKSESSSDQKEHYLHVGAALVLEKGTNAETFTEEIPIATDVLVDVLSAKTPEELSEPGAKTALKEELTEKVKEAYEGKKVLRVLFTSFVMQ